MHPTKPHGSSGCTAWHNCHDIHNNEQGMVTKGYLIFFHFPYIGVSWGARGGGGLLKFSDQKFVVPSSPTPSFFSGIWINHAVNSRGSPYYVHNVGSLVTENESSGSQTLSLIWTLQMEHIPIQLAPSLLTPLHASGWLMRQNFWLFSTSAPNVLLLTEMLQWRI